MDLTTSRCTAQSKAPRFQVLRSVGGTSLVGLGLAAFLWLDAAGQTTPTTPVKVELKRRVEKDLHAFAAELKAKGRVIPSEVYALLRAHLGKHPYIYGATLAFKPV